MIQVVCGWWLLLFLLLLCRYVMCYWCWMLVIVKSRAGFGILFGMVCSSTNVSVRSVRMRMLRCMLVFDGHRTSLEVLGVM
jgi:hypothetical protein